MFHGRAVVIKDVLINDRVVHEVGKRGNITAFLPEQEKYAVMFPNWGKDNPEAWVNYSSKKDFDEYFDYLYVCENHCELKSLGKLVTGTEENPINEEYSKELDHVIGTD